MRMNDKESYVLDVNTILSMYKDYDCHYDFVRVAGKFLPELRPVREWWCIIIQHKGTDRTRNKLMYSTQAARDDDYERLAQDFEANKIG